MQFALCVHHRDDIHGGLEPIEAACWAPGQRKFYELADIAKAPVAIGAVQRIDAIFAIEREITGPDAVSWRYALLSGRANPSDQRHPSILTAQLWWIVQANAVSRLTERFYGWRRASWFVLHQDRTPSLSPTNPAHYCVQ